MSQSDIVSIIIEAINTIFSNFFTSIDNSIYDRLDSIVFINSKIIDSSIFNNLLNSKNSFIYLADSMLVGICVFYIIRYYYSNYVQTPVEKPLQFIFKLFIFSILINSCYFVLEQVFNINYLFSSSIQEIGSNALDQGICFNNLVSVINNRVSMGDSSFSIFSIDGIVKSFLTLGLLSLLISYSIRFILIQVLVLFSPFAFLSLINYSTSWIFKSWAKSLFALLIIQPFIAFVLIILLSLQDNLLFIGGIYTLYKLNSYVKDLFGGLSLDISNNIMNLTSFIKR